MTNGVIQVQTALLTKVHLDSEAWFIRDQLLHAGLLHTIAEVVDEHSPQEWMGALQQLVTELHTLQDELGGLETWTVRFRDLLPWQLWACSQTERRLRFQRLPR